MVKILRDDDMREQAFGRQRSLDGAARAPCDWPFYDCCDPADWCLEEWGVCVSPN
jgi:hypothetical protein